MGERRFQCEPLTSAMIIGLDEEMELLWRLASRGEERAAVEELMACVCIGFGPGLRGEEITLTSLKGMLHFWEETINDKDDTFIMVALYGRSRGRQVIAGTASPSVIIIGVGFPSKSVTSPPDL